MASTLEKLKRPSSNGWSLDDFFIIAELFRSDNGTVYKARFKNNRSKIVVLKERRCAELGGDGDIMNEVLCFETTSLCNRMLRRS